MKCFRKNVFTRSVSTTEHTYSIPSDLFSVSGQSSVDFIYNLVEKHEGAHGDFSVKEGRPLSGQATFIVTVCSFLQL